MPQAPVYFLTNSIMKGRHLHIALKILFCFLILSISCPDAFSQFSISANQRYILKDGKPFFWLGDTAWELFHRLDSGEADGYLKRRAGQGFTVIQAVVLAEFDGLHTPNRYGQIPLLNDDPEKPNEKYFEHVDFIIDRANSYGICIGLLPTWGDKIFRGSWGIGPEIFNEKNAAVYGEWLAKRYKNRNNIIWILGGDRNPRNESDIAIWRAMGNAIKQATGNKALISFHPQPNALGSAEWFHNEKWLDFNMFQTGHCRDAPVYDRIRAAYNMLPVKPVMDAEPIYEDHPVCFNQKELGTSNALDVRKSAWLGLLSGAFGHTYGCHDIWQMYSPANKGINGPHVYWPEALELPGANQMIHLRKLLEEYPFHERVPDQSLILENNYGPAERIQAARGNDYILVYSAAGKAFTLVMGKIKGSKVQAYWYNPRNGNKMEKEIVDNSGTRNFKPPASGYGQDWVLVIEMVKDLPRS